MVRLQIESSSREVIFPSALYGSMDLYIIMFIRVQHMFYDDKDLG